MPTRSLLACWISGDIKEEGHHDQGRRSCAVGIGGGGGERVRDLVEGSDVR